MGYIQGQHLDKKPEFLFTEKNILPDLATVLELSELKESVANIRHDHISDFLEWVLYEKFSSADQNGYWSAFPHLRHPFARRRKKKLAVAFDDDFQFLLKVDPAFEQWRALAAEWTIELKGRLSKILRKGTNKLSSMEGNRISLSNFFINYMHRQKLEKEPSALFGADTRLPDLAKALSWHLYKEVTVKNYRCAISDFLEWVLRENGNCQCSCRLGS